MARKPLTTRQAIRAVKALRQEVMPPAGFSAAVHQRLQAPQPRTGWAGRLASWLAPKPVLAALAASTLALALVLLVLPGQDQRLTLVKSSAAVKAMADKSVVTGTGAGKSAVAGIAAGKSAAVETAAGKPAVAKVMAARPEIAQVPAQAALQAKAAPAKALPNLNRQPAPEVALVPQSSGPASAAAKSAAAPLPAPYSAGAAGMGMRPAMAAVAPKAASAGLRASISALAETSTATPVGYTSKAYPTILRASRGGMITIKAQSAGRADVRVTVYDRLGRQVAVIEGGILDSDAKLWDFFWKGTDESGAALASGIYMIRVQGPGYDDRHKVVVLR
jgi:hypothetical protein